MNNKIYIGSSCNIETRFRSHKWLLKLNKHHSIYLQNAWNKYGEENFEFIIIEICHIDLLLEKEQNYLNQLNPEYNISKSSSSPMKDRKHSEETKLKLSGRLPWNKGIPRTEEEKKKMSQSKIGKKASEEAKLKMRRKIGYWRDKEVPKYIIQNLIDYGKSIQTKIKCSNGQIYNSQIQAAKELNIRQGHISEVCQGKRAHVNGYKFEFVDKFKINNKQFRTREVVDHNNIIFVTIKRAIIHYDLNENKTRNALAKYGIYEFEQGKFIKYV